MEFMIKSYEKRISPIGKEKWVEILEIIYDETQSLHHLSSAV